MAVKVMTFNVLVGGGDRLDGILGIVAAQKPDVLVLEECVGWEDGARLAATAAAMGVPHAEQHAILGVSNARPSGRRYNVCVLSRPPIARAVVHAPPDIAHSIVQIETELAGAPLVVLGTHLVSGTEDDRLAETHRLLSLVPRADFDSGQWVLAGDLNALSRRDPYPPDFDERLERAGMDKYGRPARFDVLRTLEDFGWIDALNEKPRSSRWVTAPREVRGVRLDTRTDYVLLSPAANERLLGAEVVDVGGASDHHAVVAELQG